MTSTLSTERGQTLERLMAALVTGDGATVEKLVTDDITVWSPNMHAASRAELVEEIGWREDSLTNIRVSVDALDVVGDKAIAEWRLEADHTGAIVLEGGDEVLVIEPTGNRLHVAGATFAEFAGDKIRAVRSYFDDAALLEQLLGLE